MVSRNVFASLLVAAAMFVTVNGQWTTFETGTEAGFRGLDVVDKDVIWASGTGGTVIRTVDGGKNWKVMKVPGAGELDFRDIEAFGKDTAYILSIGNGAASRIYKTTDGGDTWKLQFTNEIEAAFFDSIAFWDNNHGIAQSDPVDGRYVLYVTEDGENWSRLPTESSPEAKEGEAAFAASGTCVVTHKRNGVFLITGGTDARVLFSGDRGRTWSSSKAPLISGENATGIFGIAMRGEKGVIVGGDYTKPDHSDSNIAYSTDGGKTWQTRRKINPFGYRSGATFVSKNTIVIVGTGGSDISFDAGETWQGIDKENYNSVAASGKNAVWAVGPKGRVARLDVRGLR